jgi:hypothetical protein
LAQRAKHGKRRERAAEARDPGPDAAARIHPSLAYLGTCALLGAVLGWVPVLVHGPIPAKFDVHGIDGSLAVWAWYAARMLIGVWVGLTRWPSPWFLRGPLCGALSLLPVGLVSLAVPDCGPG